MAGASCGGEQFYGVSVDALLKDLAGSIETEKDGEVMTPQMSSTVHSDASDASASVVQRIRSEYLEMPGLTLTVRQAARLLG